MVTEALWRGKKVSAIDAYRNRYKLCTCAVPGCSARLQVKKTPNGKNIAFYSVSASDHTHKNTPQCDVGSTNMLALINKWNTPGTKREQGPATPPPGSPPPKKTKGTDISTYGFKSISRINDLMDYIDKKGFCFQTDSTGNLVGNVFTSYPDRHAFLIGLCGPQYGFNRSPLRINLAGQHIYHATPEKIAGHTLYAKIVGRVSEEQYITAKLDLCISIEIANCDNPIEKDDAATDEVIKKMTSGKNALVKFDDYAIDPKDRYRPLRRFLVSANWIVEEPMNLRGEIYYARIRGIVRTEKQFCVCEEVDS